MSFLTGIRDFFRDKVFAKIQERTALIIVAVLCVVMLLFQYFRRPDAISPVSIVGAVIVPFQEGINEVGRFLFKSELERLDLEEARARITELEKENAELRRKYEDRLSLAVENEELRALLLAKDRYPDYHMTEARIIGNDGVNYFERFTIDKGKADGIAVNMNVINADGLVGIVTFAGLNYSIVTSIIEDGTNVSAMTRSGHENCIVTGDADLKESGRMRLENALADVDLSGSPLLVTAYISDRYLPNLPIGYASDVSTNDGGLTQSGFVRTCVDFTRLQEVLVITDLREELKDAEEETE